MALKALSSITARGLRFFKARTAALLRRTLSSVSLQSLLLVVNICFFYGGKRSLLHNTAGYIMLQGKLPAKALPHQLPPTELTQCFAYVWKQG